LKKRGLGTFVFYLLIILVAYIFMSSATSGGLLSSSSTEQVSYDELVEQIQDGNVSSIDVSMGQNSTSYVKAELSSGSTASGEQYITAYVPTDEFNEVLNDYTTENPGAIEVNYAILSEDTWSTILMVIMMVVFIGFLFFLFMSQQGGAGGGKVMNFGKSKAKLYTKSDKTVTFNNVAGADEEKEELAEIVDFLKYPDRYMKLGARIPKGVLLVGPPGTGKTLLARATAGEAGVPFFTISGSDFVEMFVGVGASRVRDLFENAKKSAPCIVFIDEIDAVGRHRGAGLGGGNDEREQTLNQLLVEMDGFSDHQGIIVIAATNRADILDPALLRPGRFDRQVTVGIPDVKGREEILLVHSKNKPVGSDVNFKTIAKSTSGFTGADLENVMNEASLLAARNKKKEISMSELEEAIKRVIAGPEKRSKIVTEADKKITAYHETGHAIVSHVLPNCDPVHEVSIIPRGMAAGYTINLPDNDNSHMSKHKLLDTIAMFLGGRAAEEIMLDDICTGAVSDIERATKIARSMIVDYGMSEKLGPIAFGSGEDDVFLGRDLMKSKNYSEEVASSIDQEVKKIIDDSYERAKKIISDFHDKAELVASTLMEKETLSGEEFVRLFETGTLDLVGTNNGLSDNTDSTQQA
jgi:cell division protease FtsH